jgi:hypothetical protein
MTKPLRHSVSFLEASEIAKGMTERRRKGETVKCTCGFVPRIGVKGSVLVCDVEKWSHRDARDEPCEGVWWSERVEVVA